MARMPGSTTRGSRNGCGRRKPPGNSVARVRRDGPAAAITTFDPWFNPWPE